MCEEGFLNFEKFDIWPTSQEECITL